MVNIGSLMQKQVKERFKQDKPKLKKETPIEELLVPQSIDDVSPQMAAKIVQQYVLPMFNKAKFKSAKGEVHRQLMLSDVLQKQLEECKIEICDLK